MLFLYIYKGNCAAGAEYINTDTMPVKGLPESIKSPLSGRSPCAQAVTRRCRTAGLFLRMRTNRGPFPPRRSPLPSAQHQGGNIFKLRAALSLLQQFFRRLGAAALKSAQRPRYFPEQFIIARAIIHHFRLLHYSMPGSAARYRTLNKKRAQGSSLYPIRQKSMLGAGAKRIFPAALTCVRLPDARVIPAAR